MGGADYEAATGTVTIPAGTLSVTVPVHVFGDLLDEPDETFTATLSAPVGAAIGDGTATGTIVDDDPPPAFSVNDVSIVEGNLGTTPMEFKVALSSASAKTISVAFATAATGATAGVDYQTATGTLTFNPGETLKSVLVQSSATRPSSRPRHSRSRSRARSMRRSRTAPGSARSSTTTHSRAARRRARSTAPRTGCAHGHCRR